MFSTYSVFRNTDMKDEEFANQYDMGQPTDARNNETVESHGIYSTETCTLQNYKLYKRSTVGLVNCKALFEGSKYEQGKALAFRKRRPKPDSDTVRLAADCATLRASYRTCPNTEEELQFPIAFSILCHKNSSQVERLLRNIYQPQNVYCLHPDAKSSQAFHKALQNIATCFPNVFIASKLESVVYASYSRLQADINCMQDMLNRPEKWMYLINLVGQALPLKTNQQLVQILKVYNGSNDIEGIATTNFYYDRVGYHYDIRNTKLIRGNPRNVTVPGNLTLIRGSAYGVFSRAFLEFALTDRLARRLLDWSKDTRTPDEHFWATLHHLRHNPSLKSPGGFHGLPENNKWMVSYSKWQVDKDCGGKYVHYVCIFGVKDLPGLAVRPELFANKFYEDYQPVASDCMEEWINERTLHPPQLNLTFYKNLPFVRERAESMAKPFT